MVDIVLCGLANVSWSVVCWIVCFGSVVNPVISMSQGYDGRITSNGILYDSTQNVGDGISAATPLSLAPGNSLVSCISRANASDSDRPYLSTAAVLTVLAVAPPPQADGLRGAQVEGLWTLATNM